MNIEDLTKAFWMLNGINVTLKVVKVEDDGIYLENGVVLSISALVRNYNKEYGE